jgi:hypothetical protein
MKRTWLVIFLNGKYKEIRANSKEDLRKKYPQQIKSIFLTGTR